MVKKIKKYSPENQSAQYLANLLGWNVAGFEPKRTPQLIQEEQKAEQVITDLLCGKRKEQPIDITKCLSDDSARLNNVFLQFIVIAFILRTDDTMRSKFLEEIDPDVISNKFARYLLFVITKLEQENLFSIDDVQNSIDSYGLEVLGHELSPIYRLALYSRWFQVSATNPTTQQFINSVSKLQKTKERPI